MKTICAQCKNKYWSGYRYGDICKATFIKGVDLVTGENKIVDYEICENKNNGNCADFTKKRSLFQKTMGFIEAVQLSNKMTNGGV